MYKKVINSLAVAASMLLLTGCVASETKVGNITKVEETQYPEGITVSMYDAKIKDKIRISDARMSFTNGKKQLQLILNNDLEDTYNIVLKPEWTDSRGAIISTYPRPHKITLTAKNSKRVILDAPNFKAKNVLLNIECGSNCVVEKK